MGSVDASRARAFITPRPTVKPSGACSAPSIAVASQKMCAPFDVCVHPPLLSLLSQTELSVGVGCDPRGIFRTRDAIRWLFSLLTILALFLLRQSTSTVCAANLPACSSVTIRIRTASASPYVLCIRLNRLVAACLVFPGLGSDRAPLVGDSLRLPYRPKLSS